jgi:hypothetical protein
MPNSEAPVARGRRLGRRIIGGAAVAASLQAPTAAAQQPTASHGWVPIFDGRTLTGWKGSGWGVEDGALVTHGIQSVDGICTEQPYADFVLRFRANTSEAFMRSAVAFRLGARNEGQISGLSTMIARGAAGALRDHVGLRVLEPADFGALGRISDTSRWIDHAIYANGGQVRLFVNGRLISDHIDRSPDFPRSGRICLYGRTTQTDSVRLRDIEIRELEPRPEGPLAPSSSAVRFRKHVLSSDFVSEGVAAADVDRDGDADIIAGALWFEAPGWKVHELRTKKEFSIHRGYSDSFLDFSLDVNRDGWADVVQFDFPGRAGYWYENPRGAAGPWTRRVVHPAVASESPLLADVNGDGRDDLLFVDAAARQMVWMEPPGKTGDTSWTRHIVGEPLPPGRSRAMPHGLGFGDVDGDGRRDVLSIDAWYRAPARTDGVWKEQLADLGGPAAQMYAVDVDGDGDQDVVSSSAHDYGLWWHEQARDSAGVTRWILHTIDDRVSVMHALAPADIDGDGTMDLVTGKRFLAHNGNDPGEYEPSVLLWYRGGKDSDGRAVFTPYLIDGDAGVGLQIVIRDVTGDGRPDIVTSSKKGVFVFERLPRSSTGGK